MKLVVSNLPDDTTTQETQKLFTAFGKVEDVSFLYNVYTKKFRGMAYILMPEKAAAKTAMEKLNGSFLKGNRLSVKAVIPKHL